MDDFHKQAGRISRGQIALSQLAKYQQSTGAQLLDLLLSGNPQERTIAAKIMGSRKSYEFIQPLCKAFQTEKALYPRIAISDALSQIGAPAVLPLVTLLGKIGTNQEVELPTEYCNKKSYPLVRDLAARTLVNIGVDALPELIRVMQSGPELVMRQALDAIGAISSRSGDYSALPVIKWALTQYPNNTLIVWKIARALSGFKSKEAAELLVSIFDKYTEPAIKWEVIRSLGQIGYKGTMVCDLLERAGKEGHPQIKHALQVSLRRLHSASET